MGATARQRSMIVDDFPFERAMLVGCGAMAGAMLGRWLETGLDPTRVTVVRPSGREVAPGVAVLREVPAAGPPPSLLLLGVKPGALDAVAPAVAGIAGPGTLLLSILAGVTVSALEQRFASATVLRAMPNLPVGIGQGVVGLHAPAADAALRERIDALMRPLGLAEWIEEEGAFDAVTALAGSGPAFLYRFIDAVARGGAAIGLPRAQAERLALATVAGAAAQAARGDAPPGTMADRVASRGGSTRRGLDVLDEDGALDRLVARTLAAAQARNREMGQEAAAPPATAG